MLPVGAHLERLPLGQVLKDGGDEVERVEQAVHVAGGAVLLGDGVVLRRAGGRGGSTQDARVEERTGGEEGWAASGAAAAPGSGMAGQRGGTAWFGAPPACPRSPPGPGWSRWQPPPLSSPPAGRQAGSRQQRHGADGSGQGALAGTVYRLLPQRRKLAAALAHAHNARPVAGSP